VNNILKHAKARNITIDLELTSKNINLLIADDGVGFDIDEKPKGIGLRNIQSRVEFYSGNLRITSAPNQGSQLQIKIPTQGYVTA
jgi:signal transduction histidine kinase